jgi:3-phosphoshikimate 1-carboxyvinyltransferase
MATQIIAPVKKFQGSPLIPGDKSVSHRALIFGALAKGVTKVSNLLKSEDVLSTRKCLEASGVKISDRGKDIVVIGLGGFNFTESRGALDCGNSGTTMRLMMGVLAGQEINSLLFGDASLSRRPMKRVADPLRVMGASIDLHSDNFAPVKISGTRLSGINYDLKIASAQIKTAILLAGLNASGKTTISGEIHSRDHTERMLNHFGVNLSSNHEFVSIVGGQKLIARDVDVPSDPSTAAFWLAASSLVTGGAVEMKNISLNESRTGFMRVLKKMNGILESRVTIESPEPMGIVTAKCAQLRGCKITREEIPSLIDEIPLIAVLATQAEGETIVEGAEELRVKESDRLSAVAINLRAMGVEITERPDGFLIRGPQKLKGCVLDSFHDHRIAMAFSIAALVAEGDTSIKNSECVDISYPNFYEDLRQLTQ